MSKNSSAISSGGGGDVEETGSTAVDGGNRAHRKTRSEKRLHGTLELCIHPSIIAVQERIDARSKSLCDEGPRRLSFWQYFFDCDCMGTLIGLVLATHFFVRFRETKKGDIIIARNVVT